jgi:hypothetical protein
MSIKSLFGFLVLSSMSVACGASEDIEPEVAQQQPAVCNIAVQSSNGTGHKTTATIVNNGNAACAYTLQLGIAIDGIESFGVYWEGTLSPGQSVSRSQVFEFEPPVFDVGDQCSQYYVLVTDPRGTRMTTADCS